MKYFSWSICAALLLFLPRSAAADSVYPQNALRVGAELPLGDLDKDASLGDAVKYRVPVGVEIGVFLDDAWLLGLYGDTGLGEAGSGCDKDALGAPSQVECNFSDLRLAFQIQNHGWLSPVWVGLGAGWEWFDTRASFDLSITDPSSGEITQAVAKVKHSRRGPFLMLSAGLDWLVEGPLRFGPYVSLLGGQYITEDYECPAGCPSGGSIDDPSPHGWIGGGVRGSFGPPR